MTEEQWNLFMNSGTMGSKPFYETKHTEFKMVEYLMCGWRTVSRSQGHNLVH